MANNVIIFCCFKAVRVKDTRNRYLQFMFTWEIWCRYGSLKVGNSQIIWENIDGLFKFDQKLKNQRYCEFKAVFFYLMIIFTNEWKLYFLGEWFGIEWDDHDRGKHDGTHGGIKYFECRYITVSTLININTVFSNLCQWLKFLQKY